MGVVGGCEKLAISVTAKIEGVGPLRIVDGTARFINGSQLHFQSVRWLQTEGDLFREISHR